ncbi:cytochrome P450, partial [Zychaea mexicana]|uniref:cytochrome P450 n=1 Tax=Zychaea mexicana TaxID=64656 RepID=UPI0022FEBD9A
GPLVRINMGVQPWVLIGNCQVAHELLNVQSDATSGRPFHLFMTRYNSFGRGPVFTDADKQWKMHRASVYSIAGMQAVHRLHKIEKAADKIVDLLVRMTAGPDKSNSYNVNVTEYMHLFTLNAIADPLLGMTAKSLDDPLCASVFGIFDSSIKWNGIFDDIYNLLPGLTKIIDFFVGNERRMKKFISRKRNPIIRQLIQQALEDDAPNVVKELHRDKERNGFDDDDILVFLVNVLSAAIDTTATTICWTFLILCCHQDLQGQLYKEIETFVVEHKRLPTYNDRTKLPLMISVQKECMRYRAAMYSAIPHKVTKDFEYAGYFFPKDTVLLANTYTINRDESYYQDPEKFMPERYLNDQRLLIASADVSPEYKRDQFVFGWEGMIFKGYCYGYACADAEVFTILIRVLAATTIEPPLNDHGEQVYPDLNAVFDAGFVAVPLTPHVRFIERPNKLVS